jgi:hypothetical protein
VILSEFGIMVSIGLSYVALHFLLYVCLLRDRPILQSERGIFLYHFVSAILFTAAAVAYGLVYFSDAVFAIAIGLVATHCIYSISFLELWTLAEGSYSMSILTGIASQGMLSRNSLIDAFARIGDAKKGNRLSVLSELSLARREYTHWQLSAGGRLVAHAVNVLIWLAAIKKRG